MKRTIRSNSALRRKPTIIIFHPTTALAIATVGSLTFAVFYIFELSPYLGWALFIVLSSSIYLMAPNGLGDVLARAIKPPKLTRGCNLYQSPVYAVRQEKARAKATRKSRCSPKS